MRQARIKEQGDAVYHIVSRVVDRRFALKGAEKERFLTLLRRVEGFSGCQVLTYCILDNHFHLLLHVPQRQEVNDRLLLQRLYWLYDGRTVSRFFDQLNRLRTGRQYEQAEALRERYLYRMYDLSEFVKTLKQRFTQGHNRRRGRRGTLWEGRFKSVLIGGSRAALCQVGAYIDLNAVRAGVVADPKDYRYCGYGAAMGGDEQTRRGLFKLLLSLEQSGPWDALAASYRCWLFGAGQETLPGPGETGRPGFSAERVRAVLAAGGRLPLAERLRCRVRYFTDGLILGSACFVEQALVRHRACFSERCRSAQPLEAAWGKLCTARRLRGPVIGVPMRA